MGNPSISANNLRRWRRWSVLAALAFVLLVTCVLLGNIARTEGPVASYRLTDFAYHLLISPDGDEFLITSPSDDDAPIDELAFSSTIFSLPKKGSEAPVVVGTQPGGGWYSRCGKYVAFYREGEIRVLDRRSRNELFVLAAPQKAAWQAAQFSRDGRWMAAIQSGSDHVGIWNIEIQVGPTIIPSPNVRRLEISLSNGQERLLLLSREQCEIWNPAKLQRESRFDFGLQWEALHDCDVSPDGRLLAVIGDDGVAEIWDVERQSKIRKLVTQSDSKLPLACSVCFLEDNTLATISGESAHSYVYNRMPPFIHRLATPNSVIQAWDISTGRRLQVWRPVVGCRRVRPIPGSRHFLTADYNEKVSIWRMPDSSK